MRLRKVPTLAGKGNEAVMRDAFSGCFRRPRCARMCRIASPKFRVSIRIHRRNGDACRDPAGVGKSMTTTKRNSPPQTPIANQSRREVYPGRGRPGNAPWMRSVASPPSSTMMSRFSEPHLSIWSVHHQYSSRVSPFHAKTLDASLSHRGSSVVLGGEDVARAPAHVGTERKESLDENRGLDGHVQGAGDVRALQGLGGAELLDHGHQAGHLDFREFNLEATVMRDERKEDEGQSRNAGGRERGLAKRTRFFRVGRENTRLSRTRGDKTWARVAGGQAGTETRPAAARRNRLAIARIFVFPADPPIARKPCDVPEVSHGHVLDLVFATGDGLDGAHSGGGRHLCRNLEGRWGRSVA